MNVRTDPVFPQYLWVCGGRPLALADQLGLSANDVQKILDRAKKATDDMTKNHYRVADGGWGNWCSVMGVCERDSRGYRRSYWGCGAQTDEVRDAVNQNDYDNKWKFEKKFTLVHFWLEGTSDNKDDPRVIIDPWNYRFYTRSPSWFSTGVTWEYQN